MSIRQVLTTACHSDSIFVVAELKQYPNSSGISWYSKYTKNVNASAVILEYQYFDNNIFSMNQVFKMEYFVLHSIYHSNHLNVNLIFVLALLLSPTLKH